ncbi:hypothetical protein KW797_03835 [Candidatus Parcubacteria bacterium]|nr:hypothetical protein [Candidatus Parcubacteria bacterium]
MAKHSSDSTPSCKFYENNSFACFGCHVGGSPIDLVMGVQGVPRGTALVWLERNFLKDRTFREVYKPLQAETAALVKKLKSRRSSPSPPFSPLAFKQTLNRFLFREVLGIADATPEDLKHLVFSTQDGLLNHLDLIWEKTSEFSCQEVKLVCEQELRVLAETVKLYTSPEGAPFRERLRAHPGGSGRSR